MIPVINLFWGALVKTGVTWLLTARPDFNVRGAALATVLGFGIAALLNVYQVQRLTGMPMRPLETIFKPLLASAVMGISVVACYGYAETMFMALQIAKANHIATIISVVVGAGLYLFCMLMIGGITRDDLLMIPRLGPSLVTLAARFHILRG